MTPDDFAFVARLLKESSGLVLTRDKSYLLENRLIPVVRANGLADMADLLGQLRAGDNATRTAVVDAMLAKDTAFFRDWSPFKHLRDVVLPNLCDARRGNKTLRILCAGSSTGQEPYSIAMQIAGSAERFRGWQVQIVGVDLSETAVTQAQLGAYNQFEVQRGLPVRLLLRHFTKDGEQWHVADGLKRMVSFKTWNLIEELYPLGRFDVILCRNVLTYFDQQTKLATLQKLARLLPEDGVLYVGINETVTGVSSNFTAVLPEQGIYAVRRDGQPQSRSMAIAT